MKLKASSASAVTDTKAMVPPVPTSTSAAMTQRPAQKMPLAPIPPAATHAPATPDTSPTVLFVVNQQNAKISTNAKPKSTTASPAPAAETLTVATNAHVPKDTKAMASHVPILTNVPLEPTATETPSASTLA